MTNMKIQPASISQESSLTKPATPVNAGVVTPVPDSPLFNSTGLISAELQRFLLTLPRPDREKADPLTVEMYEKIENGNIALRELDRYLQEAVFKKNADKFSYELSGAQPTPEQIELLRKLGFCDEVRVESPGIKFDTAIIWGGTLAAVEARITSLLEQPVDFSRTVLLGTNTRSLDKGEKTHASETEDAMRAFLERCNQKTRRNFCPERLPTNESEMVAFVWEAMKPSSLEHLPVITIDTPGRSPTDLLAKYKHVPGTADTFGYLLLFAKENKIDLGRRFIAASSEPHILRQTVDAEYKLRSVDYPFDVLSGIGRANSSASITLYLQEIAKLVNTQQRIATLPSLR